MRRAVLALVLVLVGGATSTIAGAANGSADGRVDLRVGVRAEGTCEADKQHLPTMVSATDLQPGGATGPVVVCARSKGAVETRLTMSVTEVQETDVACTGDEASVDGTCGDGQVGELAKHLVVRLTVQPRCKGPFGPTRSVGFADLAVSAHVVTAVMKSNQVDCISVTLVYPQPSPEEAAAAQTDRVRWRYAFDLSG